MDLIVEAELKRALAEAGCPLCRAGEEAVRRYLRFVLHESVNDPATRSRLAPAWGFCRRHAWHFLRLEWATMRDGLGTANIVEGLLTTMEERLRGYLAIAPLPGRKRAERVKVEQLVRTLTPTSECPACRIEIDHDDYSLRVLLSALADEEWRERVERSGGLCLPHLRKALAAGEAPDRIRWLIEDHRRRIRALLADLEEYIRKHDYRFSHEPYAHERDAFVRATAALAGSWFDLPRCPPGGDGSGAERVEAQGGERHG